MLLRRLFIVMMIIALAACSGGTPSETPASDIQPTADVTETTSDATVEVGAISVASNASSDAQLIAFYADIPTSRGEDGAFILGNPDAPIKIIEFADFLCRHCQDYHDVTKQIIENHVLTGRVKIEYRFFPIIDQNASPFLAVLNECADQQGKFWATHSLIYELAKSHALDQSIVTTIATRLGMNADMLTACMSGAGPFQFQIDYAYGQELFVSGTPAIRVQVGDNPVGVIKLNGTEYARGGVTLDVLTSFITSENPAENVVLVNRILTDNLLIDDSLISTNENCQLPCWRGVIPGETSLSAAQEILGTDKTIANIEFQESETRTGIVFSQAEQERICCQLVSDGTGNVDYISLQFTATITLGQVIERYGEPAFAEGQLVTRDQALFTLFYPDVPMILYAFAGLPNESLSEDSPIVGMALPTSEIMDVFLATDGLSAWRGFVSYDEFLMAGAEKTPMAETTLDVDVTQTP